MICDACASIVSGMTSEERGYLDEIKELKRQVSNLQTELSNQMIIKVMKPSPLATAMAETERIREEGESAKKELVNIAQAEIKAAFLAGWKGSDLELDDAFEQWRKGRAFQW